jgi:hypothetical protein
MNILTLTREQVREQILNGKMRPENLKHYDICKAIAEGKKQNDIADDFEIPDTRHVRYIKHAKCRECPK